MAVNGFTDGIPATQESGVHFDIDDPHEEAHSEPLHSPTVVRKTGPLKPSPLGGVKRSASTPNVRRVVESEAAKMSLAEKRRNKLGYHRTSIACSHCRRRKIRCLVDDKDPHGRCANCIRLKKDCNFFPVDQQPPVERRPRSGSKTEASSNEAEISSTSSPRAGGSVEQVESFGQYQQLATPISEAGWNHSYGGPSVSPAGRGGMHPPIPPRRMKINDRLLGPLPSRTFPDYPQHIDTSSPWDSPAYLSHSPLPLGSGKPRIDDPTNYWRTTDSPGTPAYVPSQFPVTAPSLSSGSFSQPGMVAFTSPSTRDDPGWPHPNPHVQIRSMSMVSPQQMPSHQQNQYYADFQGPELKRRPTNPGDIQATPSLHNSGASSTASTVDSHAPPSLASFHGQHLASQHHVPYAGGYPSWSHYPDPQQMSGNGHGSFGGWYGEDPQQHQLQNLSPQSLGQVREDEIHHHYQEPQYSHFQRPR